MFFSLLFFLKYQQNSLWTRHIQQWLPSFYSSHCLSSQGNDRDANSWEPLHCVYSAGNKTIDALVGLQCPRKILLVGITQMFFYLTLYPSKYLRICLAWPIICLKGKCYAMAWNLTWTFRCRQEHLCRMIWMSSMPWWTLQTRVF